MGLGKALARYVDAIGGLLLGHAADAAARAEPDDAELLKAVADAHREWQLARTYFDCVTDPRLVDYAILSMGAAEKRYMFLLDEARRRGLEVDLRLGDGHGKLRY